MYFAVLIFVNVFVMNITFVFGESMLPTLNDRQIGLVWKVKTQYDRCDIVITNTENPYETHLIKRVIGIEGDHLEIRNSQVYVNGRLLQEEYLAERPEYGKEIDLIVPENTVFLMGDNRNHSRDSRHIGPIAVDNVIGKLILY